MGSKEGGGGGLAVRRLAEVQRSLMSGRVSGN